MKATTAFAMVALALAGSACSEPAQPQEAEYNSAPEAAADVQATSAEDDYSGFNLSVPSPTGAAEDTGGFNLSLGDTSGEDRLLIGGEGLVNTDFGDTPDVGIDLGSDAAIPALEEMPAEDDGLIRLEPK